MTMAYQGNEPLKLENPIETENAEEIRKTIDDCMVPEDRIQNILDDAFATLVGPRQGTYGAPKESFQQIADFWDVYLSRRAEGPLTTHDVANMMILMRVSRSSMGHHYDSALDIVGYAALKEVI